MKTTISGIAAALLSLLSIMAVVPSELQKMIMEACPKTIQPYIAIVFAVAAFIAKTYQAQQTQDKLKESPADTTTITVQNEKTVPPESPTP